MPFHFNFYRVLAGFFFALLSNQGFCQWPLFTPPTLSFLLAQTDIETKGCPPGEGRLKPHLFFSAHTFCKTFCPQELSWQGSNLARCINLKNEPELIVEFDNLLNKRGMVMTAKIRVQYRQKTNNHWFEINTHSDWYCYESNTALHLITCANDS